MSGPAAPPGQATGLVSPFLEAARVRAVSSWLSRGARVLDVGCGRAALLDRRPDLVYTGVDVLGEMIEANTRRHANQRFFRLDFEHEEYPNSELYDAVVMLAVVEHFADPAAAIARAAQRLRLDGRLLITTPTPLAAPLLRLGASLRFLSLSAAGEHHSLLSLSRLRKIIEAAGLEHVASRRFLMGLNQVLVAQAKGRTPPRGSNATESAP